jgi:hypothetical protein
MTKSLTNKIFLKRQLYILWMKEGTKIVDHLNVFNTLIFQLSSMDVTYEDEDKEGYDYCVHFLSPGIIWSQLCGLSQHMPLIMTLLWELCCLRK